ncbi:MAG: decaprenyl-phosphate phosphoribosyltransferase [Kiritimatiellae bacterium]|nr:decaprenyl-phosphate phosphoribosyltransferase [Kiritimatiellia bacterium]MDD5520756.1 decaprenyl-phosphate phosphoribosyltransferase [Kiritimatiellia bacterium]
MNTLATEENKHQSNLERKGHPVLMDYVHALRPNQWTKNIVVLAALFFAFWDRSRGQPIDSTAFLKVPFAAFIFCIISSGIYILNDIKDINVDRNHPVKKNRPIPAGIIPFSRAWAMVFVLLGCGLTASFLLPHLFTAVMVTYIIIQIVYSYGLKQVAFVDVLVIASGFVLRAIAGAVAIPGITISPWLLLCTFLLALFLALCKRRHEKFSFEDAHRPSLEKYDQHLLDQLIAIVSACTIVSYAIYTLWPKTVEKFGTHSLGFTIPFVVFGIFRYLDLVYRHEKGDRPEIILLTDLPLLTNLALYAFSLYVIFSLHL